MDLTDGDRTGRTNSVPFDTSAGASEQLAGGPAELLQHAPASAVRRDR
jgi:hypothetical protein